MVEPLRHRQTKGAETDMLDLTPPRHVSTLPTPATPERPLGGQESARSTHSLQPPQTVAKGGKRAYEGRFRKDRSPDESRRSIPARNTERDDRPARSIVGRSSSFSQRMFSKRTLQGRHRSGPRRLSTGEDCGPPLRTGRFPRADSSLQRASHARQERPRRTAYRLE
jgi:hypothetical protein